MEKGATEKISRKGDSTEFYRSQPQVAWPHQENAAPCHTRYGLGIRNNTTLSEHSALAYSSVTVLESAFEGQPLTQCLLSDHLKSWQNKEQLIGKGREENRID